MKEAFEKIKERLEKLLGDTNFEKATQEVNESFYEGLAYAYGEALSIVSEVEAEYGNGWIPCSERLPDMHTEVLVYGQEGYIYLAELYDTKIYGKVWKQWNGGDLRLDWVVAWMPLPEPYKPEKGAK